MNLEKTKKFNSLVNRKDYFLLWNEVESAFPVINSENIHTCLKRAGEAGGAKVARGRGWGEGREAGDAGVAAKVMGSGGGGLTVKARKRRNVGVAGEAMGRRGRGEARWGGGSGRGGKWEAKEAGEASTQGTGSGVWLSRERRNRDLRVC